MRYFAWIGVFIGLVPLALFARFTADYRIDAQSLGFVFGAMRDWLGLALAGGALLTLVGTVLAFLSRNLVLGVFGVIASAMALTAAYGPIKMKQISETVPPIHDITTDWTDPPAFIVVAEERTATDRPAAYDAGQTAQQLEAYPDVVTLVVEATPGEAFEAVLSAFRAEGIVIKDQDVAAGHVEGTVTTSWFGFKDDVVARIRDGAEGTTQIDLRSKSRVGQSDLGANANRIRSLRTTITQSLEE